MTKLPFQVKDILLSELGRKEISIAENEMKGLMGLRKKFGPSKILKGARIAGCLHMTIQTAVLIETLVELGAQVQWSSSNCLSTQDHAAAAIASKGIAVYAWKGETLEEYNWCIEQTLFFQDGQPINMILDEGSDLTSLVIEKHPKILSQLRGITQGSYNGINYLSKLYREKKLKIPTININDSITKSKFDNFYGCGESLIDGIKSATNIMIAGKVITIAGYGYVGKGCAKQLSKLGARILITEIDPINALQASMDGHQVVTMEYAAPISNIFITTTGCPNIITSDHFKFMKDDSILCNLGHLNTEIDIDWLNNNSIKKDIIKKDLVDRYTFIRVNNNNDNINNNNNNNNDKYHLMVLSKGNAINISNRDGGGGHPSFIMSISFCNHVFSQISLCVEYYSLKYSPGIHILQRSFDEEIARLHLNHLGGKLTVLTPTQSNYLGIDKNGTYKPSFYRY
ncbi:hypothetical protein ACTFIW_003200 [Dictyostelium discoideum]